MDSKTLSKERGIAFGTLVGVVVWLACYVVFLVFPTPLSVVLGLFLAPFVGGYSGARLGGERAGTIVTLSGLVVVVVLGVVYIPRESWEPLRDFWGGLAVFVVLSAICNLLLAAIGSSLGAELRNQAESRQTKPKQAESKERVVRSAPESKEQVAMPAKVKEVRGTLPPSSVSLHVKIAGLEMREQDLKHDLKVLEGGKAIEGLSSQLVEEKVKELQKQLLEVILEKERLISKSNEKKV